MSTIFSFLLMIIAFAFYVLLSDNDDNGPGKYV